VLRKSEAIPDALTLAWLEFFKKKGKTLLTAEDERTLPGPRFAAGDFFENRLSRTFPAWSLDGGSREFFFLKHERGQMEPAPVGVSSELF
jgi:hypothetical protein